MTRLVFATNNKHKLTEIREKTKGVLDILSLHDIGFSGDIPETRDTIQGNALQKAFYIFERYKISCFADDTGLEVEALNGAPGVYSARYAGENPTYEDNYKKLLKELNGVKNRKAVFRTCIALVEDGKEIIFDGKVGGVITEFPKGEKGFGYDPVFIPDGFPITFAEMDLDLKNKISHRAEATSLFLDYISKNYH